MSTLSVALLALAVGLIAGYLASRRHWKAVGWWEGYKKITAEEADRRERNGQWKPKGTKA
jgi:hypothetical protein